MQQYKRPEAIKRMNELAGSRKPFLFIIDYKQQCSLIEEISRIDSTRCRYNFNGGERVAIARASIPCKLAMEERAPGGSFICPYTNVACDFSTSL